MWLIWQIWTLRLTVSLIHLINWWQVLINVSERKSLESKDESFERGQLNGQLLGSWPLQTYNYIDWPNYQTIQPGKAAAFAADCRAPRCVEPHSFLAEMERPVDPAAQYLEILGEIPKFVQGSICMLAQPQKTQEISRHFPSYLEMVTLCHCHFAFEKFETCFRAAPQHLPKPVSKIRNQLNLTMCWMHLNASVPRWSSQPHRSHIADSVSYSRWSCGLSRDGLSLLTRTVFQQSFQHLVQIGFLAGNYSTNRSMGLSENTTYIYIYVYT